MARKRMIDPSIWADEEMARLKCRQQLMFIGLFSNADDEGRLRGSVVAIRLMLPAIYGQVSDDEIRADLEQVLTQMRHLTAYEIDGRNYLAFKNYDRWQKIDHPTPSQLPAPPSDSVNVSRIIDEPSLENAPNRKEVNRREKKEIEEKVEAAATTATAPLLLISFDSTLRGLPGYRPNEQFYAKVLSKYPDLDYEEEALKIAYWVNEHQADCTTMRIFNWLKKAKADQSQEHTNGRTNGSAGGDAPTINEFTPYTGEAAKAERERRKHSALSPASP